MCARLPFTLLTDKSPAGEFFANGNLIGTDTAAPYSIVWASPGAGTYVLSAKATDNLGAESTSAPRTITVSDTNTPPTVALTAPANNAHFSAPANLTVSASATAPEANDTIAKVEFFANGNLIGTDTSSPYSFSWTNVAAGTYTLSAIATDAQGASTTSAVRTIVVDAPPTISLVADPTTAVAPATIVLTASANDADGTITKVEFFQGAALIATVNAPGPYTFTVNIAGAGIYSFSARATDNMGLTATSAAATVTVTTSGTAATIYYIYTDQLNTPRAITNEAATPVWKWDNVDPFGANAPNEDPDEDANNFVFNLRFAGQYLDRETNTHYNYYRDYDPSIGRYIQSDPIGLRGGVNTYAYVRSNPLSFIDPTGLLCIYSQSTGSLTCTNDITGQQYLACTGYAGQGVGYNNPAAQNQQNVGPLPQGDYTVGAPTRRRGPRTLPLTPDPGNIMYGRSGFLIHGDNPAQNNTASEGCIVAPPSCRAGIPTGETVRVVQ